MLADVAAAEGRGRRRGERSRRPARAEPHGRARCRACCIEQQVGIETVMHYCCRDRNLLGMLTDLLGAPALGLRNLLLITGDPPKMGPYPDATAVFDIDSIGLTNMVSNLNHGLDPGGNPIGEPTSFAIGVGVNPGAIDLEHELRRFDWKVEAGAEYAITQPVFDVGAARELPRRIEHMRIPIIAGIWPLVSFRNAEFLANEVPGVVRADRSDRADAQREREEQGARAAEGIAIAREMLERVRPLVQGVQVSAPFGKVELALQVFEGIEGINVTAAEEQLDPADRLAFSRRCACKAEHSTVTPAARSYISHHASATVRQGSRPRQRLPRCRAQRPALASHDRAHPCDL